MQKNYIEERIRKLKMDPPDPNCTTSCKARTRELTNIFYEREALKFEDENVEHEHEHEHEHEKEDKEDLKFVNVPSPQPHSISPHKGGKSPKIRKTTFLHNLNNNVKTRIIQFKNNTCFYSPQLDTVKEHHPQSRKLFLHWLEKPQNVLIIKKPCNPDVSEMLYSIADWLFARDMNIIVEPGVKLELEVEGYEQCHRTLTWTPEELPTLYTKVDFVVSIGGDGTLLYIENLFKSCVPPILSFAAGSLGFLTPFSYDNFESTLELFIEHGSYIARRMRLKAVIERKTPSDQKYPEEYHVMNEVLVDRGPMSSLSKLYTYCDDVPMTTVQGDGIIVAPPTGSTAYSLAAGGSMVHPLVPCILFTPVCPHSLSFRPMIFPDSITLRIVIPEKNRNSSWVSFDGRDRTQLFPQDSIIISMSQYPVPTICREDETDDWLKSIREGLCWNHRVEQK